MDTTPHRKPLAVDMSLLEAAFEQDSSESTWFLDLESGEAIIVSDEIRGMLEQVSDDIGLEDLADHLEELDHPDWIKEAILEAAFIEEGPAGRFVRVPDADPRDDFRRVRRFISTVEDADLRGQLERAISGRRPFARFRDVLANHRGERQRWFEFRDQINQANVIEWLHSIGVEPLFDPRPPRPDPESPRARLLAEARDFVQAAARLPGVVRIGLIGSLTTTKEWPKDVDMLVVVDDDADLAPLAKEARRLAGHAQSFGSGADVFLADPAGHFLGRTCPWTRCGPGIRRSCHAVHCGRRTHLYDDLPTITLPDELVAAPPLEVWPEVIARVKLPDDVWDVLIGSTDPRGESPNVTG